MDNKERTEAGNALVQWFNSQEIAPQDASAIMTKVLAKILVGNISGPHTRAVRGQLDEAIDRAMLNLVNEVNERIFNVRRS
jgi:hypothetical protein